MITFTKDELRYENGTKKEWIITNGLGGYASSSIINVNTRKYHGLLVSSNTALARTLQLVKMEETIHQHEQSIALSANKYPGTTYPQGYQYLEQYTFDVFPTFTYNVNGSIIKKSVVMPHGFNATVITYKFITKEPFLFSTRPLVNARSIHEVTHITNPPFSQYPNEKTTVIKTSGGKPILLLGADKAGYQPLAYAVYNMEYERDYENGYEFREDHWSPGEFLMHVKPGVSRLNILAVGGQESDAYPVFDAFYQNHYKPLERLFDAAKERAANLIHKTSALHNLQNNFFLTTLVTASDSFIIHHPNHAYPSVIAGYPWFGIWTRDALISFPGLLLVTGRYDDARQLLIHLRDQLRKGLLPNTLTPDGKGQYNAVDAPLWYILAAYSYIQHTGDVSFIRDHLWKALQTIIQHYVHGTDYRIFLDDDGLISAGNADMNLTWMDVKIGNNNYPERYGKAVEVNALWYNALKVMEYFSQRFSLSKQPYTALARHAKDNFSAVFWNPKDLCLFDVVRTGYSDASIRPNQIFAVSLPYMLLSDQQEIMIVKKVKDDLLTPYGLRSLSIHDPNFRPHYTGNQTSRDQAYHNGTAWGYLLGPFIRAYLKVNNNSQEAQRACEEKIMRYIAESFYDYGIGTLGEIYDGAFPFDPKGCISQAWSVATILEVYLEDLRKTQQPFYTPAFAPRQI